MRSGLSWRTRCGAMGPMASKPSSRRVRERGLLGSWSVAQRSSIASASRPPMRWAAYWVKSMQYFGSPRMMFQFSGARSHWTTRSRSMRACAQSATAWGVLECWGSGVRTKALRSIMPCVVPPSPSVARLRDQ
eukprot:1707819-Prymnesium_polylepis.2